MLNVVVLNGGRGAATLIPSLLARQGLHVTSVVNAYDDGKSTGEIRRFFGMLGPSDIRKVQELMLPQDDPDFAAHLQLFRHRYPLDAGHDETIAKLSAFARGESDELAERIPRQDSPVEEQVLFGDQDTGDERQNPHAGPGLAIAAHAHGARQEERQ